MPKSTIPVTITDLEEAELKVYNYIYSLLNYNFADRPTVETAMYYYLVLLNTYIW